MANERPSPTRHLRDDVRAMAPYTPGEQINQAIKLNTNECPWPPAPAVIDALNGHDAAALRLYPDPMATGLRRAAAARFAVRPEQILAGNGSDDCLTILYRSILRPGDRVAVPHPTYGLYDTLAALQGAEMVHVPWAADWSLPDLSAAAARLVLLANPNNPSATLIEVARLRALADAFDGILVIDEAYVDFADEQASILPYIDAHPNLVVLRTFSKSYALAGVRLGLLFAADELVAHLVKVKDSYNVNALTQDLGTAAIESAAYHRDLVDLILAGRRQLETDLARFGWSWPPSQANFLLCRVGPTAAQIYRALKQRNILVRWFDTPELRDHLRITVGTPEQNRALITALESVVA